MHHNTQIKRIVVVYDFQTPFRHKETLNHTHDLIKYLSSKSFKKSKFDSI